MKRKRICFCTTISATIKAFLLDFAYYLVDNEGYDVTFICDTDESLFSYTNEHIHYCPIKMKRGFSIDGISVIYQFYKIFKREKFDIVQYSTRNAATYGSIAAKLVGIKCRLYCQWGMMFIALKGLKRALLKWDEKLIVSLSTVVESESYSMYEMAIKHGIYKPEKASVIWNGSACGVNINNYDLSKREIWKKEVRAKYNIPEDGVVFGWCGRITRDKGHNELFEAFRELNNVNKNARLLMVGPYDNVETINPEIFKWAQKCKEVIFTGPVPASLVPEMYSAMDLFCSLSYREGFGLVVIEAAAMQVPGIVSDALGQRDTIVHMKTGYSVATYSVNDVVQAMKYFLDNPEKIVEMGANARRDVEEKYEQKELFKRLAAHRNQLILESY